MTLFYQFKKLQTLVSFAVLSSLLLAPFLAGAQSPQNVSTQEQCFIDLKASLAETGLFEAPLTELGARTYSDIAPLFGEKKNTLTSFDVTVDQPILGIRLYSFGQQTGYTHPPKTVLPVYTKSDTWGDPVKEYVIAEEYVTDPQGKEHFLNCVFLHIDSEAPMSVTQEKYAYDGIAVSVLKTAEDGSYKAWYNQAPGFDYDSNHFVTWKRMIVYPESAQNTYFSRYAVMDAYPATKVEDFDDLSFFLDTKVSYRLISEANPEAIYTTTDPESGEVREVEDRKSVV